MGVFDWVVVVLLIEFDGIDLLWDVVMLGVINWFDLIDLVLLCLGWLEWLVFVELFDVVVCCEILCIVGKLILLSFDVDLDEVVVGFDGYSVVDCVVLLCEVVFIVMWCFIDVVNVIVVDLVIV